LKLHTKAQAGIGLLHRYSEADVHNFNIQSISSAPTAGPMVSKWTGWMELDQVQF
jgi:hypothetical protein